MTRSASLPRFLLATGMLWLMWLVLTMSLDPQEMLVGAVVAAVAAAFTLPSPRIGGQAIMHPRRLAYAVAYVVYLLVAIVKSNLDVARRVLSPKLDIHPGVVQVETKLKSPVGRLILANSITLTPGTLTVDIRGDALFIHWIDVRSDDSEKATHGIVAGFEKYLEVIFG